MHILLLLSVVYLVGISANQQEYLYPVGYTNMQEHPVIFLLYQKSNDHLELWQWDPETKIGLKALLSTYFPASLRVLPDGSGFSFIDNDRLRIKYLHKRSPKTIDFFEPIYDVTIIEWLDNQSCYFSARYNHRFCIFFSTADGILKCLVRNNNSDYFYPQIVNNYLFYIERTNDTISSIAKENFCRPILGDINDIVFADQRADGKEILYTSTEQGIAFLHMISDTEGFFVQHPLCIKNSTNVISFMYCMIQYGNAKWVVHPLFSFDVLADFLIAKSPMRLYESMLPLLPVYSQNKKLYYTDMNRLMCFDIKSGKSSCIFFHENHQCCFGYLPVTNKLYYGGIMNYYEDVNSTIPQFNSPAMWFDTNNNVCFHIPTINI